VSIQGAELAEQFGDHFAKGLDPAALALLGRHLERWPDPPATLIEYGKPSDRLYLLPKGTLAVVSLPGKGEEVPLGPSRPWVGELGLVSPGPASATVRLATRGEVWVLTSASFHDLCFPADQDEEARRLKLVLADHLLDLFLEELADRVRTMSVGKIRKDVAGRFRFEPDVGEEKRGWLWRLFGDWA
jgi:CRP-like cAMP-binding protein